MTNPITILEQLETRFEEHLAELAEWGTDHHYETQAHNTLHETLPQLWHATTPDEVEDIINNIPHNHEPAVTDTLHFLKQHLGN